MNICFDDLFAGVPWLNHGMTKIAVAVSGGVDSMALMHLARELNPTVLHVNHCIRPESDADAEFVAAAAARLGLESHVLRVCDALPVRGLEDAARRARYELLFEFCRDNGIDVLMTAHQADDNIETFLMNLGRGSGIYGLAGMRTKQMRNGVLLVRPLLSVSRHMLETYCRDNGIDFRHDSMNLDENFRRVAIRKNRHVMADKLGISDARILTAIDALSRVREHLESEIDAVLRNVSRDSGRGPAVKPRDDRAIFPDSFLFGLTGELVLKCVSRLIQEIGGNEYPPRLDDVKRAVEKLRAGDTKFQLGHCNVRRLGSKIMIAPIGTSISFRKKK
ncbi:MAG: tRNA lysidine(34) synthetase TilS [Rickettsiales bacterium]|nr:tRNA lysidine(34) synthetase TilS [Rickettsiales bacterium]